MDTTTQVLVPSGILDSTQAAEVRAQVSEALATGARTLLIDLKNITFIDSSGLGTLISVLKKVRSQDCEMVVCSASPQVKMLFELTSMDQVFQVYENRAAFDAAV